MTRDKMIEVMAKAAADRPFDEASSVFDRKRLDMAAALSALEAAGVKLLYRGKTPEARRKELNERVLRRRLREIDTD